MNGKELLVFLSIKYKGDFKKIYHAIETKESYSDEEVNEEIKKVKSKYITILDDAYPQILKRIQMPPLVLFYYGNLSLISNTDMPRLGVVGSRECSEYGRKMTENIVKNIAKNVIVVSGLARGIDGIAHKTCIENGGKTIAVLGCGIDYIYPRENTKLFDIIRKDHLLISEYPNSEVPVPENFSMRNRIVAGLSKSILVTEAYKNSGTNITVLFALRDGKDVYVVPYPANVNSSCNRLIKDGAYLVENSDDVLYYLK